MNPSIKMMYRGMLCAGSYLVGSNYSLGVNHHELDLKYEFSSFYGHIETRTTVEYSRLSWHYNWTKNLNRQPIYALGFNDPVEFW